MKCDNREMQHPKLAKANKYKSYRMQQLRNAKAKKYKANKLKQLTSE